MFKVFHYDGSTVTQITEHTTIPYFPQINAAGDIVWYGNGVYLYDGATSTITKLTDSGYAPQINDNGDVVWYGLVGSYNTEIFFYERATSTITQLTDSYYSFDKPQINSNGDIVWQGRDRYGSQVFLAVKPLIVNIDIKPGNDSNPINLKNKGVIPVAILTTEDFEAIAVDSLSVTFGPDEALDSDGEGQDKFVIVFIFHFRASELPSYPASEPVSFFRIAQ